jgi:HK97 gp10 family phage protein
MIHIKGIDSLVKKLNTLPNQVQREAGVSMQNNAWAIEKNAKINVKYDTGRLRASIHTSNPSYLTYTVSSNVKHAPYIEFGTKSKVSIPSGLESYASQFRGGGGSFTDLVESIEGWTRRKGIAQEFAYPIALKIAREGISASPFLFPAYEAQKKKIMQDLKKVINERR